MKEDLGNELFAEHSKAVYRKSNKGRTVVVTEEEITLTVTYYKGKDDWEALHQTNIIGLNKEQYQALRDFARRMGWEKEEQKS